MSGTDSEDRFSLSSIRDDEFQSWLATIGGIVIGVALASVHWFGLLVGGALVSLPADTPGRGFLAGIGFGVFAWLVFLVMLAVDGVLGPAVAMGEPFYLSLAIAVGLGGLGGLVRCVI